MSTSTERLPGAANPTQAAFISLTGLEASKEELETFEAAARQGGGDATGPAPGRRRYAFDPNASGPKATDAALPSGPAGETFAIDAAKMAARTALRGFSPAGAVSHVIEASERLKEYLGETLKRGNICGMTQLPCASKAMGLETHPSTTLTGAGSFADPSLTMLTSGLAPAKLELQMPHVTALPEELQGLPPDGMTQNGQQFWYLHTVHNALENLHPAGGPNLIGQFRRAAEVKLKDPFPTQTQPTGMKGGVAFGLPEKIPAKSTKNNQEDIREMNELLARMARAGYLVVLQPTETTDLHGRKVLDINKLETLGLKPKKKPDALIEGRVFDVYSPRSNQVKTVYDEISGKATSNQAHRIVLNLTRSDVTVQALREYLKQNPISNLKEIIVEKKPGNFFTLFPFQD